MINYIYTCIFLAFLVISCSSKKTEIEETKMVLKYPETKKINQIDNYFGTSISDPYRWLEDDRSEETENWVANQNEVTFSYLEQIPFRAKLKERLKELWNYPKYSAPFKKGNKFYFYKNDGLQNQSVLFTQDNLESEPSIFLDPNTLKEDGTAALGSTSFSKNGNYFAYAINDAGSDWQTIYIKNVITGEVLKDELKWAKFTGMAWKGEGFYYSKYDVPEEGKEFSTSNEYHKVYYHKLNTNQSDDELVFWQKDYPKRYMFAETSEDENYLFINVQEGISGSQLYFKDLRTQNDFVALNSNFKNDHYYIDNEGDNAFIYTNYKAPNYRLVKVNLSNYYKGKNKDENEWKDFIVEHPKEVLEQVSFVGNVIIAKYMKDAHNVVYTIDESGKRNKQIELPTIGSVNGFDGTKSDSTTYYSFTSYTYPSTIFSYNITTGVSKVYRNSEINFNSDMYETSQVFYKSKDGTEIPMFLTRKKGIKMDGTNPVYLYGYGGFNISLNPGFRITMLPWLENGGIFAVANLRGGGEYGEKWHKQGMLLKKQNVFDDFIAASEFLIEENYTSKEKLAIAGGSNGGLLVGACMTQRPDLFQVALPAVGVLDMLRYHKFTVGWGWAVEYGSSDDSTHFNNLIEYSPLHNIEKDEVYPATLVTTADHDDRVVPAHSFKFISELQAKHKGESPVLIRVDVNAGHGAGKPTEKVIEEWADIWSFTLYNMNEEY